MPAATQRNRLIDPVVFGQENAQVLGGLAQGLTGYHFRHTRTESGHVPRGFFVALNQGVRLVTR